MLITYNAVMTSKSKMVARGSYIANLWVIDEKKIMTEIVDTNVVAS